MIDAKEKYTYVDWTKVDSHAECDGTVIPVEEADGKPCALRTEDFAFLLEAFLRMYGNGFDPSMVKASTSDIITANPSPSKDLLKRLLKMKERFKYWGYERTYTSTGGSVLKGSAQLPNVGFISVTPTFGGSYADTGIWFADLVGASNAIDFSVLPTEQQIDEMDGFDGDIMRRFFRFVMADQNKGFWARERAVQNSDYYMQDITFSANGTYEKNDGQNITDHSFSQTKSTDSGAYLDLGYKITINPSLSYDQFSKQKMQLISGGYVPYWTKPKVVNITFGTAQDHDASDVRIALYVTWRNNVGTGATRKAYAKLLTPTKVGTRTYSVSNVFTSGEFDSIMSMAGAGGELDTGFMTMYVGRVMTRQTDFALPNGKSWNWQPS